MKLYQLLMHKTNHRWPLQHAVSGEAAVEAGVSGATVEAGEAAKARVNLNKQHPLLQSQEGLDIHQCPQKVVAIGITDMGIKLFSVLHH